jgi:glycosyltransferase involved in cell wall biosynthesis
MENIAIITYPFISGLYYLAESFRAQQELLGNKVFLIPKKSFVYQNGMWRGIIKSEMPNFLEIKDHISYDFQILNFVKKFNIKKIYSFETFMKDTSWMNGLLAMGIQIIDIPMPEWSVKSDLESGKYKKFSKVYCLTNQAYNLFNRYSNAVITSWDYCPDLKDVKKEKNKILTFYHPGSNAESNQKNTHLVLEAFTMTPHQDIRLLISGFTNYNIRDKRVTYLGRKISRQQVYSAYSSADCIISPSTREGLGMCFYEARKFGCDIITTDSEPMNQHSKYLCRVSEYNKSDSLVPFAIIKPTAIVDQINKYYEDFYGKN